MTQNAYKKIILILFGMLTAHYAYAFDSGSDGSDGALDFTWAQVTNKDITVVFDPDDATTFDPENPARKLDTDNDNVFKFSTVLIPLGVTVYLRADKLNWKPVYWLTTGDFTIELGGTLSVVGQAGHAASSQGEARFPAIPGPGGFAGGLGASSINPAQAGFGPGGGAPAGTDADGGGASHASVGGSADGTAGNVYGSPFLLPLIGGSGGAGGGDSTQVQDISRSGGGAGGGAIVIASNTKITNDGRILANGGAWGGVASTSGGAGSGGSVRLLAPQLSGNIYKYLYSGLNRYYGYIDVRGGISNIYSVNAGGNGRLRIETNDNQILGNFNPDNTTSIRVSGLSDTVAFLPTDNRIPKWPSISVTSINGVGLPSEPKATFALPDSTVNTLDPVPVVFTSSNIPITAVLKMQIVSPDSGVIEITPTYSTGDVASSTWAADVAFPVGFSRGYLQATWNN